MGYMFSTNHSMYTVSETNYPDIMVLNGGRFKDLLIYKPKDIVSEGQPFVADLVESHEYIKTSPIRSLHRTYEDKVNIVVNDSMKENEDITLD